MASDLLAGGSEKWSTAAKEEAGDAGGVGDGGVGNGGGCDGDRWSECLAMVRAEFGEEEYIKAGDSSADELATATQVLQPKSREVQGSYLPITREKPSIELVKITGEMKSFKAYDKLCIERHHIRI
nr:60S ribosomal protein L13-1 [Ipomoea batatas]